MNRKIIHIDMDAFFASVEQRDNPMLKGRPVAVGHANQRGVVAAASYEARKYGVHSAMPSRRALKLCPSLIFVPSRFSVYKEVSRNMHDIFHEYTDVIEPISLDEAFLDVTENKKGMELAVDIAREIKLKIREQLNLIASAGVSYNKFLAKIASDLRKPDGLCTIHPSVAQKYIDVLRVEQFWGVGPVTAQHLRRLGIETGADLRAASLDMLIHEFGKQGMVYYQFARGIDLRPVSSERIRKSVGCEHTLEVDIETLHEFMASLMDVADDLNSRLKRNSFIGATVTLKLRFSDFSLHTRSQTAENPKSWTREDLIDAGRNLFEQINLNGAKIRLVGLTVSNPPGIERDTDRYDWAIPGDFPRQLLLDFEKDY